MTTSRFALVTSFNCEDRDWQNVWNAHKDMLITFCGQKEMCPDTKRLHWHFFIKYNAGKRKTQFQNLIDDNTANVKFRADMDGDPKVAETRMMLYTQKEDTYVSGRFKFGEIVSQGKRTDLDDACAEVLKTGSLACLVQSNPALLVKNHKGLIALLKIARTSIKRNWEMDVRIYFGKTGTGKTRAVYEEFGIDDVYSKPTNNKWWDGYIGQKCVLLDEFDPETNDIYFNINTMKNLTDRHAFLIEDKGGYMNFCSKVIIICTNDPNPYNWWREHRNEDCNAIKRRIQTWKRYE